MAETATVLIEELSERHGEKNGRPWTKWSLKDANGTFYGTFSESVIEPARELTGKKALIEFEVDGKFRNLVSVAPLTEDSPLPRAERADGSPDWDVKGLHMSRNALWKAYIGSPLIARIAANCAEKGISEAETVNTLSRVGKALVVTAEVDQYHRPPAGPEEDIPFG